MRLVRALFLFTAKLNINVLMHRIPGQINVLADALSRLQVNKFRLHHPTADHTLTPISSDVWQL